MRSIFRLASSVILALSIALGTIGAVTGVAQAAAGAEPVCPWSIDIITGARVCPANKCGFLGLKTCTRVEHFDQDGNYLPGEDTCECK